MCYTDIWAHSRHSLSAAQPPCRSDSRQPGSAQQPTRNQPILRPAQDITNALTAGRRHVAHGRNHGLQFRGALDLPPHEVAGQRVAARAVHPQHHRRHTLQQNGTRLSLSLSLSTQFNRSISCLSSGRVGASSVSSIRPHHPCRYCIALQGVGSAPCPFRRPASA
jgi:hypothetical protein